VHNLPAGQTYEVRHGFGNNYFYKGLHPRPVLLGRLSEGAGKSFRGCRGSLSQKKRGRMSVQGVVKMCIFRKKTTLRPPASSIHNTPKNPHPGLFSFLHPLWKVLVQEKKRLHPRIRLHHKIPAADCWMQPLA
jgi:hypothetical protein